MGMCKDPSDVEQFWTELLRRGDERVKRRPMQKRRLWMRRAVAIALHGDAVPVLGVGKASTMSFDTYNIQGVWCSGPTLHVKQLLFGVWVGQVTDCTAGELWHIVTWSLHWLYMGKWPPVDWNGHPWTDDNPVEKALANTPLADGLFAVLLCLKADLDHFAKSLGALAL